MKFQMKAEPRGEHLYVFMKGRIGGESSLDMYSEIKILLEQYRDKNVVLDFSGVDFLDSSGLGALVAVNSTLLRREKELILSGVSENIMSLLKITSLHKILRIVKSIEDV